MATIVRDLISYLQCGTTIAANDAIYIDSGTGKIHPFDATNDALVFAGIAKEAGVLDDYIRVVQSGRVKGFVGLTPGQFVYASVTVPGGFQLIEPIASQKVVLGIAVSATELNINGGLGIKPGGDGGAGGGLDTYYTQDMEGLADTADFATGNNATFLGGGTFQGSLVVESVAPISGTKSLKYTQAAGSLNDYFASELIEIDPKQQNNTSGMTLYFTYNGNDNDMKFVVWDVTNGVELSNQVSFVKLANTATRYSLSFYVPASCTQIRWGSQVLVENIGAELVIDDVEMSTDPFHEGDVLKVQSSSISSSATIASVNNLNGAFTSTSGSGVYSYNSSTGVYTMLISAKVDLEGSLATSLASRARLVILVDGGVVAQSDTEAVAATWTSSGYTGELQAGQTFEFRITTGTTNVFRISVSAIASTTSILTPSDTFSTDTAPLTYAGSSQYTPSTLANAPVGTFITFTYSANTNTQAQTNAAPPTQSTSDMNVNGIQIFTRAYNAASTAASPAAIAIQIGKGLKGISVNLYKSAGKAIQGSLDSNQASSVTSYGISFRDYNEVTGILYLDAGFNKATTTASSVFSFGDLTAQTSGYLTINASKSAALTAVPTPLVAYLKDVKASGTAGGTFTAGAWQTRTLNTVEGDSSIVSLSANQFTLGPGLYEINASAPAHAVRSHKSKLRNITASTDSILGTSEYADDQTAGASAVAIQTRSNITGRLAITQSTTFEIQHQSETTLATSGFGLASGFAVNETFTVIAIKKVG